MVVMINPMDALSMSKAVCRQVYVQAADQAYDKIVIGALIIKYDAQGKSEILMLKRAAHEKIYPNIFEIPGGKVEDSDATILDAVKREVFEEAGMEVKKVIGSVKAFDYALEKKIVNDESGESSVRYTSLQLNFICEVVKQKLTVNPEEHSEGKFFSSSEIKTLELTEQMRAVVEEGFVWADGYFTGLAESKILVGEM
ncbi:MAG: hypothetical protein Q9224_002712 [Gallowayella concinna]